MITPTRYESAKFEDVPENIQEKILKITKTRKGMYIHGTVGCGKTHMMYAIGKGVIEKRVLEHVRAYNSTDMLRQMREDFNRTDKYDNHDLFKDLLEFRGLLMIDDIGAEKLSDWVLETFYLLVNNRYEQVLPTIFTSNFNLKDLSERIGDRTVSRIVESCDVFELKGKDRRIEKHSKIT